jgi:preprotein translocase subunit SecB
MKQELPVSGFKFNGYQIRDTRLNRVSDAPVGALIVEIDLHGIIRQTTRQFTLNMDVVLKDNASFTAEVSISGQFEYQSDDAHDPDHFFYLNAPAILFPHVRAYVASLTALTGMSTVIIPTLNLTSLAERLKVNTRTEA